MRVFARFLLGFRWEWDNAFIVAEMKASSPVIFQASYVFALRKIVRKNLSFSQKLGFFLKMSTFFSLIGE